MSKSHLAVLVAAALLLTPCCAAAEETGSADAPLEINWSASALSGEPGNEQPDSISSAAESSASGSSETQSGQESNPEAQTGDAADTSEEASGTDGFVSFDEIGLRMYLLPGFEEAEISEEDRNMGYIAYYEKEDHSAAAGVMLVNADGTDTRSYKESLHQLGTVSEITDVIVNGRKGVRYRIESEQALYVGFPTQAGYTIEFSFAPMDEGFSADAELMLSSIMPIS